MRIRIPRQVLQLGVIYRDLRFIHRQFGINFNQPGDLKVAGTTKRFDSPDSSSRTGGGITLPITCFHQ